MAKRRAGPIIDPIPAAEAGSVIAQGVVPGRAVPWKAPTIGRNGGVARGGARGRDYKRYVAWLHEVAMFAGMVRTRRCPYGGPVDVHATFYLRPRPGTPPDRANLLKAFEDALQGVIYVNDRQVRGGEPRVVFSATEAERVEWRVVATGGTR